jgi:GNAT superfamily N-acetyltransferase
MFEFIKVESAKETNYLNENYVKYLTAPMDGMWYTIVANSNYHKITYNGRNVGYFCFDSELRLLRFDLVEEFKNRAQLVFPIILERYGLKSAIASTVEPFYLSLCLDFQKQLSIHSYLFRDHRNDHRKTQTSVAGFHDLIFRIADERELDKLECFYRDNIAGEGDWMRGFLEQRICLKELFVLLHNQILMGTGECIVSQAQKPIADVGMVVSKAFRGKGLGTYILSELKLRCASRCLKPICSCTKENAASRNAIQKAGFISEHRILNILF